MLLITAHYLSQYSSEKKKKALFYYLFYKQSDGSLVCQHGNIVLLVCMGHYNNLLLYLFRYILFLFLYILIMSFRKELTIYLINKSTYCPHHKHKHYPSVAELGAGGGL